MYYNLIKTIYRTTDFKLCNKLIQKDWVLLHVGQFNNCDPFEKYSSTEYTIGSVNSYNEEELKNLDCEQSFKLQSTNQL